MSMNTQPPMGAPMGAPPKSLTTAALLGFFLGGIGGADFYMGYKKHGIRKAVLTVVGLIFYIIGTSMYTAALIEGEISTASFAFLGIGGIIFMVVGIWALVTFIQILTRKGLYATDSTGQPLV